MLEKCFFNVIFDVEYYNMTDQSIFFRYVYFHVQDQIIARDSRALVNDRHGCMFLLFLSSKCR